jgi:tRNA(Ile)-lysidine synthase
VEEYLIKLLDKVPDSVIVACSGGPDSMALLSFLNNSDRNVTVLHFDHGTNHSKDARELVERYCKINSIPVIIKYLPAPPLNVSSLEAWWRDQRYNVMNALSETVLTGHNLDDVAEWWIFTSLRGNSCLMPYQTKNVIKPLLLNSKQSLVDWCTRYDVPYVIDPTNLDRKFARSKIRYNIMPEALEINPGLLTTMKKKIIESNER